MKENYLEGQKKNKLLIFGKYIFIAFALVSLVLFFYQHIRNINKFADADLTSYIRASIWFFSGENPYQDVVRRFIYPQFLLLVLVPFHSVLASPMLRGITAFVWGLGLYLSFFLTLAASWKHLYGFKSFSESLKQNVPAIALLVMMTHPLLQDEFLNGQVNLFVMGSTAAFFFFLEKNKLFWAALFLAIATSIKIAPGFVLFYILFTRQYKVVLYYIPLVFIFVFGLPYLVNNNSLVYYRYFVSDVMPNITGSDFEGGFKSFSIISTLSYVLSIHWYPPLKILVVGLLTLGLFAPVCRMAFRNFKSKSFQFRFVTFGTMIAILPLTFPMSEPHHLLLQIIPFISIIAYWKEIWESGEKIYKDNLSVIFILCMLGYQIGHGLKDTPIRLLSLIGVYVGMILLMRRKQETGKTVTQTVSRA